MSNRISQIKSLVGRNAVHVDFFGARQGCRVVNVLADGSIEVKGLGNSAGSSWVCAIETLQF